MTLIATLKQLRVTESMARAPVSQRVLIIGDSMTQGGEGDYTWRYRFWQWTTLQGLDVRYVGPFLGPRGSDQYSPPQPPLAPGEGRPAEEPNNNGAYASDVDKDFDSHHFSEWGKACFQGASQVKEVLQAHMADIILVMLGFNDLGWKLDDVQGTLRSMKKLIGEARHVNPEIKLVIADIPQRTPMYGRDDLPRNTKEYNKLLAHAISLWTTRKSPIYLAELCKLYTADTASYDGLHPNALGDYQIARAFADAFVDKLKIGIDTLVIPEHIPPRPLPTPTSFCIMSSPLGVSALWKPVFGCRGYELRSRTNRGDYSISGVASSRWDSHWATDGDIYEAQVRACYGEARSGWTILLSATSRPQLAPPPKNVQLKSSKGDLTISFERPDTHLTISRYAIFYKDKARPQDFPTVWGFKQSPAYIPPYLLLSGHVYDVWTATWTMGEGFFGETQEIKIS